MKILFCSCGNKLNPKDKFCINCGREKPKKKGGVIGNIFFVILLVPFLALLGFALVNLSDYAVEYLPYLSDQKGFQGEWKWETGFDIGYQEKILKNCDDSEIYDGYLTGRKIKSLENDGKLVLRDPTYEEMKDFLKTDLTNRRDYISDTYMCGQFSRDTINHAKAHGIKAGYVYLTYLIPPNHAIICFNTTDKGLVFVEPQFDKKVKVKIGESFWGQNSFGKIPIMGDNDMILETYIMWSDGTETIINEN